MNDTAAPLLEVVIPPPPSKFERERSARIRATVGENEPWILLGRDVLNGHKLVLDGPDLALEIS